MRITERPIWLLAALPSLLWADNRVLARALHKDIPPIAVSFWRWATALLILLPLAGSALRVQWPLLLRHRPLLAILGITNYNTIAYIGLQHTSATHGVLLSPATPVVVVGLCQVLDKRLSNALRVDIRLPVSDPHRLPYRR